MPKSNVIYYLLSFVSGGTLMAMEVLSARLLTPYMGSSLYVWAATIGTTLLGLACGYRYSGSLSSKGASKTWLLRATLVMGAYLLILPVFSTLVLDVVVSMSVVPAILLSTLLFNFPLFFLFGLFSPLVIQVVSNNQNAGKYTSMVYGISTLSGVLFLYLTMLYFLPYVGAPWAIYGCGVLFLVMATWQWVNQRKSHV